MGWKSRNASQKREEQEAKKVEAKHENGKIEDEYTAIVEVGKFEDEQGWQYDTGASAHTTKRKYRLTNARPTDTIVAGHDKVTNKG
jgi:hypothetical protein